MTITAASGGLAALSGTGARAAAGAVPIHTWRGVALGGEASITLAHREAAAARELIRRAVAEIRRLEAVFSLYRADSAVAILNRDGAMAAPPLDLVRLLAEARAYADLTGGAFDVTVQPLWRLYAGHFASAEAIPEGPAPDAVAEALETVDYRAVRVEGDRISFAKPGMAVTLNGIAQGYMTDRVADLLRAEGLENVLVDLGEIRALGDHPDGRPWKAGLRDPDDPARLIESIPLSERAMATSGGYGTRFEPTGRFHHLFDPRSGVCANRYASVSVLAARATGADALSTAFSSMAVAGIAAVVAKTAGVRVILLDGEGNRHEVPALHAG